MRRVDLNISIAINLKSNIQIYNAFNKLTKKKRNFQEELYA